MKYCKLLLCSALALLSFSCKDDEFDAQGIIDRSLQVSGSANWLEKPSSFRFRDYEYESGFSEGKKVLKRIIQADSNKILDIKTGQRFERYVNDSLIMLPDTLRNSYGNAVNSVHYFARLPFGLNDPAVNKEFLGTVGIKGNEYYKVKVTFDPMNGGDDFEDVYVYWFNKKTFKPDYLAYEFHVNGGGFRFREAYNERYIGGIRFVDYRNYKPRTPINTVFDLDQLFKQDQLELLSVIELKNVRID